MVLIATFSKNIQTFHQSTDKRDWTKDLRNVIKYDSFPDFFSYKTNHRLGKNGTLHNCQDTDVVWFQRKRLDSSDFRINAR